DGCRDVRRRRGRPGRGRWVRHLDRRGRRRRRRRRDRRRAGHRQRQRGRDQVTTRRTGEPQDAAPPPQDPTEDPVVPPEQRAGVGDLTDISGVDNLIEEGAPLEPFALDAVDATAVPEAGGAILAASQQALAERTADLQRLQSEYLNYKR